MTPRGPGGAGKVDKAAIIEKRFSANLRRIIEMKGVTYEELSRLTGISKSAINNYAHGRRVNLTRAFLITQALGVTFEDLLGEDWEAQVLEEMKEQSITKDE